MKLLWQILAILAAAIAVVLWLLSRQVRIKLTAGQMIGPGTVAIRSQAEMQEVMAAIRREQRLRSWAARFAVAAAIFQAASLVHWLTD